MLDSTEYPYEISSWQENNDLVIFNGSLAKRPSRPSDRLLAPQLVWMAVNDVLGFQWRLWIVPGNQRSRLSWWSVATHKWLSVPLNVPHILSLFVTLFILIIQRKRAKVFFTSSQRLMGRWSVCLLEWCYCSSSSPSWCKSNSHEKR